MLSGQRLSGLVVEAKHLTVDHMSIMLWALSHLIIGFFYTWAAGLPEEFVRMLIFVQFMGIVGAIGILMTGCAILRWFRKDDIDGVLNATAIGMVGIFVIQILTQLAAGYQSQFLDTAILMPIVMLPVAVFEEFLYRGFLFGFMYKALPQLMGETERFLLAGGVSSLIFAAGHSYVYGATNIFGILAAFLAGMVFAYTYAKSKLLFVPIMIHFLNNFMIAFMAVLPLI